MATRALSGQWTASGVHRTTWTGLLNGDDGAPQSGVQLPNKSVQVKGTFGAGGTIIMEGSNDGGTTYAVVQDWQGAAISFTAAGAKPIATNMSLLRPRVTGGDGTTSLTCELIESERGA